MTGSLRTADEDKARDPADRMQSACGCWLGMWPICAPSCDCECHEVDLEDDGDEP